MWNAIAIPKNCFIKQVGKACLFRAPLDYGDYTFFHPEKLVDFLGNDAILIYTENWIWKFSTRNLAGYKIEKVTPERFFEIFSNYSDIIHNIPKKLIPEHTEPLQELLDDD